MVWDATKSAGDLITSSDWNDMVSDQKGHSTRHTDGGADELDAADLSGASGTSGQVLQTDGSAASWNTISQGADISEDGTQVVASPDDVNYTTDLDVTDDSDGSASVSLETTRNPNEVVYPGSGTGSTSALPTSKVNSQHAIQTNFKFGSEGSSTTSTSYTTIANSDVAIDFDKIKDRNGSVFVNIVYHLAGDASARIFRQNAGTAVSGTAVSTTASVGNWSFAESGWIDLSSETGFESYQVQLSSDDGNEVIYNSIIMLVATPQG